MKDSYSLGDLRKITGAKHRSLQVWADKGVLQAERQTDRAGTGVHRQFSRREAMIACIIHPFAERQIAIDELGKIAELLRASLLTQPHLFEAAIHGEGDTIFAYEGHKKRAGRNWPAGTPEWITQYSIGSRESFLSRTVSWPDVVMAIRLETYLASMR